ncbi:hypothetical protein F5Y02DRAFT_369004 [Annulohypoxylon stygium]|nr:hypothetical protein F5Y02DRAFT_369004 [Annulohypoxylon stygium]
MSTYEESIEKYDRIKAVDLSKICNDTNKLKLVAEDLQRELLQVYGDRREAIRNEPGQSTTNEKTQISNTNLSSTPAFWSGLEWIPAQCDYPTDTATTKSIGFGSSHMEILVYDCSRGTLEVWHGLEKLQGKRALFSKLPSRWCSELHVCVEKITKLESKNAPRYRITNKAIPYTMTTRCKIHLTELKPVARLKILSGHIK